MRIATIAIVAAMAATCPAHAQTRAEVEAAYTPAFDRCMTRGDAARGVTAGIMDCTGAENRQQDTRLNQTYRTVMARLNPTQKAVLRRSELDWIRRRNGQCHDAAADAGGGSASGIVYSSCVLDETVKRTLWLKAYRPAR